MGIYSIDKEGSIVTKATRADQSAKRAKTVTLGKDDATLKQLGTFSKQVIERLFTEKIPATPENYAIYFEKMLEEKPLKQRKTIQKILEAEHLEEHIYVAQVENNIKESFKQLKIILDTVSSMYNRIAKLKTLTKNKQEEIANGAGKIAIVAYEESLEETVDALDFQQKTLKEHYSEIAQNIKFFHANTIFDPKYDVYNRNYLFKMIESEKKNITTFGYECALLAFQVDPNTLTDIKQVKERELVIKNIANMILRRSRRSDIVAHLGNDIFVILLKHTKIEQAERVIESIDQMIGFTNFIVNSQNIEVALAYAVAPVQPHRTREQMLSSLLNQLH